MTRGLIAVLAMVATGQAFANEDCGFLGNCPAVPELDGGMAILALGLTAAVVAIVRERRRS